MGYNLRPCGWLGPECGSSAAACCARESLPGKDRANRPSGEDLADPLDATRQSINFFPGVVEAERGARGGGNAEAQHHRLCAVVPGADGDAFLIEDRADVVGVNVLYDKGEHAGLVRRGADELHAGYGG